MHAKKIEGRKERWKERREGERRGRRKEKGKKELDHILTPYTRIIQND